ncbi:polyphenol oxidase I, chloroplastic [Aegilops tauschii subsp. strangulata]|uniref:Tyrosinase copper-binding domain-containing protein n=1 Tax=Aegilops tauschii subsp. strangulata TaxID=200361 RepID=A0A453MVS1_AEGTS|nr:polyphenol oxidase I, chloroplastic [Aegilops tauschii subsp. strangulata]
MASSSFIVLPFTAAASACLPPSKPVARGKQGRRTRLSCHCKATAGGAGDDDLAVSRRLDRRDVLLGLTGVGAAGAINLGGLALAADDAVPATCVTVPVTDQVIRCVSADGFNCPGVYRPEDVVDFSALPPPNGPLRVRRPAHLVAADKEYVRKYEAGVRMMRDLDASGDPRSFKSQAAIHEAYCNFHYKVTAVAAAASRTAGGGGGTPEIDFDVHFSSIFAPWHRMYIYFFERIIGELIGDTTFALPYWNWDAPDGMMLPPIFNNASSPLYDANRDQAHVTAVMDLNKGPGADNELPLCSDDACVKENNLSVIYRQMAVDTALQFHGNKFCAGGTPGSPGSLENAAHTAVHIWVGGDMGVLGTAGRDPVFYSHHANVDRMWHLWTTTLGNQDFVGAGTGDWRDTSFVFYDEKRRPVRISVRDVLDAGRLGYTYEERETLEWLDKRPKPATGIDRPAGPSVPAALSFPVALKKGRKEYVTVERPEEARASGGSSKKAPEVLVVDVTIDPCEYAKFDVLVNVPKGQEARVGPQDTEFAGTFENLPHGGGDGGGRGMGRLTLTYRFALRELVEDLGCGQDRRLDVTLVPRAGGMVVVDDVRVELCN